MVKILPVNKDIILEAFSANKGIIWEAFDTLHNWNCTLECIFSQSAGNPKEKAIEFGSILWLLFLSLKQVQVQLLFMKVLVKRMIKYSKLISKHLK